MLPDEALIEAMREAVRRGCPECAGREFVMANTAHDEPSRRCCTECGTEYPSPTDERNFRRDGAGGYVFEGP